MARIAGVTLPDNKKLIYSLSYVYGIGESTALKIVDKLNFDKELRLKELTEEQIVLLREEIEKNLKVEGELRRTVGFNLKRLKEINCYRGTRHKRGLPARGQRTKTNSRTKRGRRQTAGSGRVKLVKK